MIKNLPVILLILVVIYVLYATEIGKSFVHSVEDVTGVDVPILGDDAQYSPQSSSQASTSASSAQLDSGMYDVYNPNAFGTTPESERRITNDGVRKEYHQNPFPWAECTCASGDCDKHGVPKPTPGHTHVCRNGFPSKRIVDMYGGHFQLNHICAPGLADGCQNEPTTLGRWFCRKGCSNAESVGLNVRPSCTRCG